MIPAIIACKKANIIELFKINIGLLFFFGVAFIIMTFIKRIHGIN